MKEYCLLQTIDDFGDDYKITFRQVTNEFTIMVSKKDFNLKVGKWYYLTIEEKENKQS